MYFCGIQKNRQIAGVSQNKDQGIQVEEIKHLSVADQCERIAKQFSAISNLSDPLQSQDISFDKVTITKPVPLLQPWDVFTMFSNSRAKACIDKGDLPKNVHPFCWNHFWIFGKGGLNLVSTPKFGRLKKLHQSQKFTPQKW